MQWFKFYIDSKRNPKEEDDFDRVQGDYSVLFDSQTDKIDAALFIKLKSNHDPLKSEIFVSPTAAQMSSQLLEKYGATPSLKPKKSEASLFLGNPKSVQILMGL